MTNTFNFEKMDDTQYGQALLSILDAIEHKPADIDSDKIFVDGEYDSNQTKFERMSNKCKIGVKANSKTVGYVLLFFLRMIIDDRFDIGIMIVNDFDCEEHEDVDDWEYDCQNLTIDNLVRVFEMQETAYTSIHDINKPITNELMYCDHCIIKYEKISEKSEDMDVWDWNRIREYVVDRFIPNIN